MRLAEEEPSSRNSRDEREWSQPGVEEFRVTFPGLTFATFSTSHCFAISCLFPLLQWAMLKKIGLMYGV